MKIKDRISRRRFRKAAGTAAAAHARAGFSPANFFTQNSSCHKQWIGHHHRNHAPNGGLPA